MAVYTRQSSSAIVDGGVIEAVDLNNEFDQLAAAFLAPTFGVGTSGADIVLTFDGETNDGVLTWMEDEDYFLFSDDLLLATTEKIQFRDTGLYINSSTDGQLDIVADTEIQIAATTIDINGAVALSGAITGATNITLSGELDAATLDISGNADIDGTMEADAITIGGTAIGSIYSAIAGSSNIVTTGALNSGSITSGFGTIDTGSSTITTTGLISGGSLDIDNVLINGTTIGHTDDTDLMTLADGVLTVAGEVDAVSLDISGDADIDGTLEADAITIGGITLAETISDTVGAMVTSNTESGITVAYDDTDNTLDFTVGTLNQDTTGNAATATVLETARTIGGTSFNGSANIAVGLAATATALATARTIGGTSFDGTANIAVALAAEATAVTGVTSTAAELNLLDALDRGSILYGNASGATAVLGQGSNGYVLTSDGTDISWAASSVSGLAADNLTIGDAAILLTTSSGNITVDAAANDSDIIFKGTDGTVDTTYLTLDGSAAGAATFNDKIIATELDISGNVDIDGTLEADVITINGTAIASVLSPIAGGSGIVTTGALNSGSITSGFGTIDTGSSTITTTGLISGGSLDIDNVLINGTTIGHTDDTDLITVADSLLTIDGDVTITGGTPTLTIGDAGAEDAKIVFDGNAQDFHIGLDDSADDLIIGKGSALGTTPVISIADTLKTTFGGGAIGATYAVSTSGNITMNFDLYTNFQITANGGNVALLNGTGTLTAGQSGVIVLIQDGTGSRTISTGSDYEWPAATVGTISTAANAVDVIPYYIDANDSILLGAPQLAFATPS
jgi:fibronectin-binding autotransporter adhesin